VRAPRRRSRTSVATTGRPSIGSTGFGQCSVTGRRRCPRPQP
jgi:hypothetical protein